MRTWEFWIDSEAAALEGARVLDDGLLERIMAAPLQEHSDIEVAAALARLAHEEFEAYGTSGNQDVSDDQSRLIMRALQAVLGRLGLTFSPPWRDFPTFYRHWRTNGGYGSWQARRDMLDDEFGPLQEVLDEREAGSILSSLVDGISPHHTTGWSRVDQELVELRRHFENATTSQDYSNVGNDCVALLEALSGAAYDHGRHAQTRTEEPPVANTKDRLSAVVEVELLGPENAELRKLARAAIEMAQAVKHRRETVGRRDAGIAADSVIILVNLIRRLRD
jgi:hypothetical protein